MFRPTKALSEHLTAASSSSADGDHSRPLQSTSAPPDKFKVSSRAALFAQTASAANSAASFITMKPEIESISSDSESTFQNITFPY